MRALELHQRVCTSAPRIHLVPEGYKRCIGLREGRRVLSSLLSCPHASFRRLGARGLGLVAGGLGLFARG